MYIVLKINSKILFPYSYEDSQCAQIYSEKKAFFETCSRQLLPWVRFPSGAYLRKYKFSRFGCSPVLNVCIDVSMIERNIDE